MRVYKLIVVIPIVIVIIHVLLVQGIPVIGFTFDDWSLLFSFKILGPNPFSQIINVWENTGVYTTHQIYYIGILNLIFDQNYNAFWIINLFFKILATLSVYPVVQIIFKRKMLALLTMFLFAINSASFGALEYIVKGIDYLAIAVINIFFINYYYLIHNHVWKLRKKIPQIIIIKFFLYTILIFFLILVIKSSPIQSFPILIFIPIIEAIAYLKRPLKRKLLFMVVRFILIYTPFLLFYKLNPDPELVDIYLIRTRFLIYKITHEGLLLILTPLFLSIYYIVISYKLKKERDLAIFNLQRILIEGSKTSIILFIALMLSPIRIYPVLVLVPLVEIYLFLTKKTFTSLAESITRYAVLCLPLFILLLFNPHSILNKLKSSPGIIDSISHGNWHIILTPLAGLGLLPLPSDFLNGFLNVVRIDSFKSYIEYLFSSHIVFLLLFSLPLAIVLSEKPLRFYIKLIISNLIIDTLLFFIINKSLNLTNDLKINLYQGQIPYSLIGIYLIILATIYLIEYWNKKTKDIALSSIWIGPLAGFVFIFSTWFLSELKSVYTSSVHWYLVIPSLFISFFIAGLIIKIYDICINKRSHFEIVSFNLHTNMLLSFFITIFIFLFFIVNKNQIYHFFIRNNALGRGASDKISMQNEILKFYNNESNNYPILFYFDVSKDPTNVGYYSETALQAFPYWMHMLRGVKYPSGCIAYFINSDKNTVKLKDYKIMKDNLIKIKLSPFCIEGSNVTLGQPRDIDLNLNNIYALEIKDKQVKNIKDDFLVTLEKNAP